MSRIPLAGVIGNPVGHSLSPRLHGHWLRAASTPGHYVPLHVEADDLETVLRTLPKAGFVGVNVTVPHKEAALAIADEVSETARQIGAANTLSFGAEGQIHADNTDAYGFIANIQQAAPDWRADAGPALVLGAGGAARAVLVGLLEAGVPEIRLTNRTRSRADALADALGERIVVDDWEKRASLVDGTALIVNTTSLGMKGEGDIGLPFEAASPGALATDIVYVPLETGFLKSAKAAGLQTVDGLGMLIHQAVPGFRRWFGAEPQITSDLRVRLLEA